MLKKVDVLLALTSINIFLFLIWFWILFITFKEPTNIDFSQYIDIIQIQLVILELGFIFLGFVLSILGFWGYKNIKQGVEKTAKNKAEEVAEIKANEVTERITSEIVKDLRNRENQIVFFEHPNLKSSRNIIPEEEEDIPEEEEDIPEEEEDIPEEEEDEE